MDVENVRKYITQNFTDSEHKSYLKYINGDETAVDWIEKGNQMREPLLLMELQCTEQVGGNVCGNWINIDENGVCKCSKNHICTKIVLDSIKLV